MGRSASFRIAQRRDFFFSLAPALPVVVGLQGPWFPVQRLSRLLDSYSRCICSDTFLSHESLRRQCTRTASVSGGVLADPPVALTFGLEGALKLCSKYRRGTSILHARHRPLVVVYTLWPPSLDLLTWLDVYDSLCGDERLDQPTPFSHHPGHSILSSTPA